jgi:hypothetical protein
MLQTIAMLWRELNKLTGVTAAPPDGSPVVSLQHALKRLRATVEIITEKRKQQQAHTKNQAEALAAAQTKQEKLLEAARKLEEQIQAERQQARDNQQEMQAVLQENEQLRHELHATRDALQCARHADSLIGCGIEEEGSDIRESSSSSSSSDSSHSKSNSSKDFDTSQNDSRSQSEGPQNRADAPSSTLQLDVRHSVAAISGDALITETTRATKDGERLRLRSVERSLENERAARKQAESMVDEAEDETQAVQRLRQVETEQWVVELERVEAAARDQIDRLAEEREEARETAMILQDDLHHERKQNIGAKTDHWQRLLAMHGYTQPTYTVFLLG